MTVRYCGRKLVPDWVTMSVPPDVARSYPIVVRRKRREPDAGVTLPEITSLLRLGYRTAQDELGAPAAERGEDFVYGSVAEVTIDDQEAVDPLGLHGRELQLRLDFYLLPLYWIRALEVVSDRLGLRLRSIVPQQALLASPLSDTSALLILIGRRNTCVARTRRGRLEWSVLTPTGADDVVSQAARALEMEGQQVEALMTAYRSGRLQRDLEGQLARAFWSELRRWMQGMVEAVGDSARGTTFPYRVYVVDGSRNLPEAAPSLQTPFWEGLFRFERCPEVVSLDPSMIRNVLDLTSRANGQDYLVMRAFAHLVAQVYAGEQSLDSALVDTIRWRTPRR